MLLNKEEHLLFENGIFWNRYSFHDNVLTDQVVDWCHYLSLLKWGLQNFIFLFSQALKDLKDVHFNIIQKDLINSNK